MYYRPPSADYTDFLYMLENLLEITTDKNRLVVIAGNFNIDVLPTGNERQKYLLVYLLNPYNMKMTIDQPTRASATCLDNIIISNYIHCKAEVNISDHYAQIACINNNSFRTNVTHKRIYSTENYNYFFSGSRCTG